MFQDRANLHRNWLDIAGKLQNYLIHLRLFADNQSIISALTCSIN